MEISNGSYVAHSLAVFNGGAFFVTSGGLRVVGGSVVTNSTAQGGAAGALWLTGGKVTLSNSLLNASAVSGEGGCVTLRGGEMRLEYATIRNCTSISEIGHILNVVGDDGTDVTSRLLLATFTTFQQHQCSGSLFRQIADAKIVLRNVSFESADGCEGPELGSSSAFASVRLKGCGDTYTDGQGRTWDTCSSVEPGACAASRVEGTTLTSV